VQRLLSTFGITSRISTASASFDLRITGRSMHRFAAEIGFSLSRKAETLRESIVGHETSDVDTSIRLVERTDEGIELTYNLSEPRNHSYVVNGVVVRNCSEYFHVDDSACNLASINLLKYLQDDGGFDVGAFTHTVDTVFTAQEILVGRADYPTEKIGDNTRALRQLGLGYANLGALLMALGLPYDSDDGRAWAAAITSLMTGSAYAASARTAARVGTFDGFADDSEAMLHVLEMHQEANGRLAENAALPDDLVGAAADAWARAVSDAQRHGVRNSQATVLAPTGCLVGGSMVATSKGLVRLRSLGDPDGPTWQTLELDVATDDGPRAATKFFVNGAEPVVEVTTARGYHLAGTTMHRIKIVGPDNQWRWKRFADLAHGDVVPLALHQVVGDPQHVRLPLLSEKMTWAGEWHLVVPDGVDEELALLVGYFMGDGSLHSRGLRFCVSGEDTEVVDVLVRAGKSLFNIEAAIADREGYTEVAFHSTRLVEWWSAAGFARLPPSPGHSGKGYSARVPDAILASNDPEVYRAFLRGLFEADGSSTGGYPSWTTTSLEFSRDVQRLLLALGFVTTRRECTSGMGSTLHVLRLLNRESNIRWSEEIGFISSRKAAGVHTGETVQSARYDHLPVSRELIDRVAPENGRNRRCALMEFRRHGAITRRLAFDLLAERDDEELRWLTSFFFDRVEEVALCDEEFTYDLSVPDNLTYIANGFVSHNTIGLAMDCDTTGIEPDLALVKTKKLVGGGTMSIVNQTIPRALRRLGYTPEQVDDIVAYIDEHMSVIGAPHLAAEHLPVFACSMGDNTIHYEGHIRMMGAVQPFLSGGISKTANMPEDVTVEDVEGLHMLAWELGLKSVAIYRDNCKLGQPLSSSKQAAAPAAVEAGVQQVIERVVHHPIRQKMPRTRRGRTFEFRVADCKGFATIGEYDNGQPGEIFLTVSKQGSTMAGVMDAFAKSVSYGLQYGVPLRAFVEAFTNMRFEPAGMTDDPDIRFASSIMDYLFRRLAIEYMTYDERAELGIFSVDERLQPTLPGVEEQVTATNQGSDLVPDPKSADTGQLSFTPIDGIPPAAVQTLGIARPSDAPLCMQCGVVMMRSGSCYVCTSCGSTSGCS
jgi:ribonucleoside-diphosphate reductase alpha chain